MGPYYVYILQSLQDGTYYKGFTADIKQRLAQHNRGLGRYTTRKRPWKVVFLQKMETKAAAIKREKQLKRANPDYLQWVIKQPYNLIDKQG